MIEEHIVFSDLDASLTVHPLTREIKPKVNRDAIKRSLVNLINLEPWDIPFKPNIQAGIRNHLFELPHWTTTVELRTHIQWLVETYEKRVELVDVNVSITPDESGLEVTIRYIITATNEPDQLNYIATRVR